MQTLAQKRYMAAYRKKHRERLRANNRIYMAAFRMRHRARLRIKNKLRMQEARQSGKYEQKYVPIKVKYQGHRVSILGVYCKVNLLASVEC